MVISTHNIMHIFITLSAALSNDRTIVMNSKDIQW